MEHAIGTKITLKDGRKVEVVKARWNQGCSSCFFGDGRTCHFSDIKDKYNLYCTPPFRSDRTRIIYKEIKDND